MRIVDSKLLVQPAGADGGALEAVCYGSPCVIYWHLLNDDTRAIACVEFAQVGIKAVGKYGRIMRGSLPKHIFELWRFTIDG